MKLKSAVKSCGIAPLLACSLSVFAAHEQVKCPSIDFVKSMIKIICTTLFSLLLLAGCAEVSPVLDLPNTYSIDCSPKLESMDTCYAAAKRYCPNGYKILSRTSLSRSNGVQVGVELGWIKERGIVVQCK